MVNRHPINDLIAHWERLFLIGPRWGDLPTMGARYLPQSVDNDVLPSIVAGMRSVWIKRGPWGYIERMPEGVAPALVVGDGLVVDYATLDQRIEAEIATAEPPLEPGSRQAVVAVADLDGITRLWARWRTGAVPIVSPARPGPDLRAALSTWELVDRSSFQAGDHTWVPTSGSTGVPKAVRLTSGNVAAAVSASQAR